MGKSKKKKKNSSSKAQYDAKKKNELKKPCEVSEKTEKETAALPEESLPESAADIPKSAEEITASTAVAVDPSDESESAPEAEKSTEAKEPPLPAVPAVEIPYDPDFSEEDFSASLNELKAEDIDMPEDTRPKKKGKKKISKLANIMQIAVLLVCGSVAIVCLFMLGENIWGKIKGQQIYSETQNQFNGFTLEDVDATNLRDLPNTGKDTPMLTLFERIDAGKSAVNVDTSGKYDQQLSQMKASLSALKGQYKDIYGWIYVEGTNINHPIVRCDDNNYYLTHTHTGEYLPVGAIFADLTTLDLITDNYNTVIYGHNVVASGYSSMFHDVEKFLDRDFFISTNIYVYTLDGAFVFKPVAIYDTVADDFYFKTIFTGEDEFLSFAKEKMSYSNIYSGETFGPGDRMLTLSTCTNGAQDGRYALHAKLIEVIK